MKFNKYQVALRLTQRGVGRKKILSEIYNHSFINYTQEYLQYQEFLCNNGIEVISYNEEGYPKYLREINDYPLLLFTKGDISLLKKSMITIVGTRTMSKYGKWAVGYILRPLIGKEIVVVSGLANGVDGEVHKKCLEYGIPTVAVVAGGIDKGYPKSNQQIYDEICNKGLVISEFPPGREIVKGMFPMRNRILAGLSSATVVIESDLSGGSLITLELALDYGRDIFCIPCNINKYSLQGCNMAIGEGAIPLYSNWQLLKYCQNLDIS
jgi:DNA processing protein